MIFRTRNFVLLLVLVAAVFAEEQAGTQKETPKPAPNPQPIPTSTPAPVTNSTSTASPSTSTSTPTTAPTTKPTSPPTPPPTTAPTTPSTTPSTPPPTTKPTTPPTPPPTTKPTTPPTPPPTTPPTTPAPTPTPHPTPMNNSWIVPGPNGTVCITANMVMNITVPYKSLENKTVESTFSVGKVQDANATGTCSANAQSLVLTWNNVSATFNFALNGSTYSLDSVSVAIAVNNITFPNNTMTNVTELQLSYKGKLFTVPQNNSYVCASVAPLKLSGTVSNTTVSGTLTVAHVHVQAFGNEASGKFRAPMDCASHETPDIVPIAVGLILAGLVVVVLIAYLVGRKRAQARGYMSM